MRSKSRKPRLPPAFFRRCSWKWIEPSVIEVSAPGYEPATEGLLVEQCLAWREKHPAEFEAWRRKVEAYITCSCHCEICRGQGEA